MHWGRDGLHYLRRFAFVRRGRSWVPSPLAGEGQGEGKSSGNESTHPNEKCCKKGIRVKSTYRSTLAVAFAAAALGLAIVPLMAGAQTQARGAMSQSELDAKAYEAFVNGKPELLDSLRAAGADPARYAKTSRDALFDALRPQRSIEVLEFVLKSG